MPDFYETYIANKARRRHVMSPNERTVPIDRPKPKDCLHIPMGCGRPERLTRIGQDDITNLKIALMTASSLEDFLEHV